MKPSESVTDLVYQQVLDNLALFHCQPDALVPIVNPEKLRTIRCVFQIGATGTSLDPEADKLLKLFLGENDFEWLPQGRYGVGCRKEVPQEALYVGHYGNTFVWGSSDRLDALTRLTIVVLNIAALDPNPAPAEPTKTAHRYERDDQGNVETMEILTRPGPDAPRVVPSQVRKDFYHPLQSQIQMQGK